MAEADKTALPDTGPIRRGGRWKTWALVISLALNLFVAAVVIGAGIRHRGMLHDTVREVGFGPFTEALSREDRAAMRDAFLAATPDFAARRRASAEDFVRLAAVLRTEPFDPAAVERLLARQGDRAAERFKLGRRLFVERLTAMTPEARAGLADRIGRIAQHRLRH